MFKPSEIEPRGGCDPDRPISVLHCIATLSGGGAEHQLKSLAGLLVDRGIDVSIFSRFEDHDLIALRDQGVNCLPIRSGPTNGLALAAEFRAVVNESKPRILQTWLTQMDLLGGALAPRESIRILSERASSRGYPATVKNLLRRYWGLKADAIVANSVMGAQYWSPSRRVEIIPNGVDLGNLDSVARGYYSNDPRFVGRRIVLSIGRLCPQKDMQTLIAAMAQVRRVIPDVLLIILGEGADRPILEALVDRLGVRDHVHFAGFVCDAPRWLKSAEAFAMASIFEGQPNAALEAAASRIPMVLSDIPEHRDLFNNAALFAATGDDGAFSRSIIDVLEDPTLRANLAERARQRVAKRSFAGVADAYVMLYRRLIDTQVRRGR